MIRQTTLAGVVSLSGVGLHSGATARVTLHPAPADTGRRIAATGRRRAAVAMNWETWIPSRMSTSVDLGDGRTVRTIEHLMAALSAHGIDNVHVEIGGAEIPIFDGSAKRWCASLRRAGTILLEAPRRSIRVGRPVQIARDGGFLRIEPAPRLEIDVTHDLLPAFPVMRWAGPADAATFDSELACARSFGNLHRRLGLTPKATPRPVGDPPVAVNRIDPDIPLADAPWTLIAERQRAEGPLLRGWRPWRATLIAGRRVLPWPRVADEPVRHVALDMIGDLALAGLPLIGRVVAHNPSHEKTFALVAALMQARDRWTITTEGEEASAA